MKDLLLTLWQLPQCIVAWVMLIFLDIEEKITYNDILVIYSKKMSGGISLGRYIILREWYNKEGIGNIVKHEYGHTRQSLYLGWLYLIVIGLPSLIHAAFFKYDSSDPNKYYRFYTESWADKLGGVIR